MTVSARPFWHGCDTTQIRECRHRSHHPPSRLNPPASEVVGQRRKQPGSAGKDSDPEEDAPRSVLDHRPASDRDHDQARDEPWAITPPPRESPFSIVDYFQRK
jgi:hypothetical protein